MTTFNLQSQLLPTQTLIPTLASHFLHHYGWTMEELKSYVEEQYLHVFTCPQQALMAFLNLHDQPVEASQSVYERITSLPLESISLAGGFQPWIQQVFTDITLDFGDILTVDEQSYFVIFNPS